MRDPRPSHGELIRRRIARCERRGRYVLRLICLSVDIPSRSLSRQDRRMLAGDASLVPTGMLGIPTKPAGYSAAAWLGGYP